MSRGDIAAAMLTRHVMTPLSAALVFNAEEPCDLVAANLEAREFDNAPVIDGAGDVIGYINEVDARRSIEASLRAAFRPLSAAHVVGSDTPLSELLNRLLMADFLHVVGGSGIVGLVTPSDFNKQAGRAYFYLLVSDLEIGLADRLRTSGFHEEELLACLPSKRRRSVRKRLSEQHEHDVAADAIAAMDFKDLLMIAESKDLVSGLNAVVDQVGRTVDAELVALRNDVMHLVKTMAVDQRASIERLGVLDAQLRGLLDQVAAATG